MFEFSCFAYWYKKIETSKDKGQKFEIFSLVLEFKKTSVIKP